MRRRRAAAAPGRRVMSGLAPGDARHVVLLARSHRVLRDKSRPDSRPSSPLPLPMPLITPTLWRTARPERVVRRLRRVGRHRDRARRWLVVNVESGRRLDPGGRTASSSMTSATNERMSLTREGALLVHHRSAWGYWSGALPQAAYWAAGVSVSRACAHRAGPTRAGIWCSRPWNCQLSPKSYWQ